MKKLFSLMICLCMAFSMLCVFPVSAETATGTCGANAAWAYDAGTKTLTISGTGSTYDYLGDPNFPDLYYLAKPWDAYVGEIENVVVGTGITRIGDAVLCDYPVLTSVTFPNTLVELGKSNITSCNALTSLILPEGLEVLGSSSVSNCTHLSEIFIPATLREVHWGALMYLNNLIDAIGQINDLNIYYGGTEEQWNGIDFCDADYAAGGGINWTKIWLFQGNYINLIVHYNWTVGHEHTWDAGVQTAAPTYSADGSVLYTCTSCGETYVEVIPHLISDIPGDGNNDGKLTSRDVSAFKKYMVGLLTEDEINFDNFDLNDDGKVNSRDLTLLKKIIVTN